jgi:hypothetical protein
MSSDPGEIESIETFRRKRHEMRLALIEVLNDPRAVDFDAVAEVERTAAGMRRIVDRNTALSADGLFDDE